jgi:hypothetical protein
MPTVAQIAAEQEQNKLPQKSTRSAKKSARSKASSFALALAFVLFAPFCGDSILL